MVGSLHEVRPGRWLYVEVLYANEHGQFAAQKQIALLVHGSMAHNSQASLLSFWPCDQSRERQDRARLARAAIC